MLSLTNNNNAFLPKNQFQKRDSKISGAGNFTLCVNPEIKQLVAKWSKTVNTSAHPSSICRTCCFGLSKCHLHVLQSSDILFENFIKKKGDIIDQKRKMKIRDLMIEIERITKENEDLLLQERKKRAIQYQLLEESSANLLKVVDDYTKKDALKAEKVKSLERTIKKLKAQITDDRNLSILSKLKINELAEEARLAKEKCLALEEVVANQRANITLVLDTKDKMKQEIEKLDLQIPSSTPLNPFVKPVARPRPINSLTSIGIISNCKAIIEISNERFKKFFVVLEKYGSGSFGTVSLIQSTRNKTIYVLKSVYNGFKEGMVLEKLGIHPFLPVFERQYNVDNWSYMLTRPHVFNMVDGKADLSGWLNGLRYPLLNFRIAGDVIPIIAQIAIGVDYFHQNGIAHNDLKPENVIINDDPNLGYHIAIVDVGFASKILPSTQMPFCGTNEFMSPEIFLGLDRRGDAADIWAFGVMIYTIFSGQHPFQSSDEVKQQRVMFPVYWDSDLIDLITGMLEKDPIKRFSSTDVVSHPYLVSAVHQMKQKFGI